MVRSRCRFRLLGRNSLSASIIWAVGIDRCKQLRLINNSFEAGIHSGRPGLFSLSEDGFILQWVRGSNRPRRLLGAPLSNENHFLQFLTLNNASPKAPVFMQLFCSMDEAFLNNWTIEQAIMPS